MSHLVYVLVLLIPSCSRWNNVVCKSEESKDGFLMLSNGNDIESIHVGDDNTTGPLVYHIVNDEYIRKVIALTYDYQHERLYYSDIKRDDIQSTFLNGTDIKVIVKDVGEVEGLAYESSGGDLYFTSFTLSSISKINVNDALSDVTIEPKVIIQQKEQEHPRAIIIENCFKSIYWTTWSSRPSIQRATLAGTDIQDIITTDIVAPNGLTLDRTTNKLYWSDARLDKVEKCDLNGSNRVIISSVSQHSFGLAVLGDYVYWTDWIKYAVFRINKVDGTGFTRILDKLMISFGILAIDRRDEKCYVEKCEDDNNGCQDICRTDERGKSYCQCTYGILDTDGKTCKVVTQIVKPPEDQRVVKGETATLHCGVSQYAKIDVTWKWTFRRLNWNIDDQIFSDFRHSISVDGTLIIKRVTDVDIGKYTCTVTSIGGNDKRTAVVTVIEVPQAPIITYVALYPDDKRAARVKWTLGFDGNAAITRFIIDYQEVSKTYENKGWVTFDSDIQPDAREVVVTDLRPYRSYQFRVTASNEVGDGSPSYPQPSPPLLTPQQPPSCYPKDLYGMSNTNSSIILSWLPPDEEDWNGPTLDGYTIQYKLVGSPDNTFQRKMIPISTDQANMKYELRDLAFYQQYDIQIAAYNEKGVGVFSPTIKRSGLMSQEEVNINIGANSSIYCKTQKIATLEGRPTASPEDVRLNVLNSTAIMVKWIPPAQQSINGKNLGYKVLTITPVGEPSTVITSVTHEPTNNLQQTSILNLKPYTLYEISVLCYTSQGDGPQSIRQIASTPEDVPSEIEGLRVVDNNREFMRVLWKPPTEANGILTGYTLSYWMKNVKDTWQNVVLPKSSLTYTLANISPMTIYTISVFASTSVGNGPSRSFDVKSWVPPGYPSPPSLLAVSDIVARSVLLQFVPVSDGGNSITSLIVEALEGNLTSEWKTIHVHVVNNSWPRVLKVGDLTPYTYYKLRIKVVNIVGQSFPSESTRLFKTLQAIPETPPGDITVRAMNATALRITWMPLSKSDWNGEPMGNRIYIKLKDTDELYQIIDMDIKKDNVIIDGLREWSRYEVTMSAYNDVGYSLKSSIIEARTMESVPSEVPQNVQAIAVSSTSVNISWSIVPHINGFILGYKVEYSSPLNNISAQYKDVPGQTTNNVIIENLEKFVLYDVRVLAYTKMGDGDFSYPEIIVKTMADTPSVPSNVWFPSVHYYEVTIEWQPPRYPRGILTGYRLAYKQKCTCSEEEYITDSYISSSETRYTVQNLQRESLYEFQLTARSHVDWGETVSLEVYTETNRGASPQTLMPCIEYSSIEARAVTISWVPTVYNIFTPFRNFTIQYRNTEHETEDWSTILEEIHSSNETYMYQVKGLRPNTEYEFRVASTNDIGTSPFSRISYPASTLEDYPEGAPEHVLVERLTRTSVKVTWQEPVSGSLNGKLLGYVLMYRELGDDYNAEIQVSELYNEIFVHNLSEYVYYQFMVRAFNSIGRGPSSTTVTVLVGEARPSAAPTGIETFAKSSTEIQVTWLLPPLESQSGDISGYQVTYWQVEDSENTTNQVTTEETSIVLIDLDIYTEYGIQIKAINQVGEGPKSEVIFETTLEELPAKPASIKFWNVTYTSLDINWQPPSQPNGKIIKYDITYQEQNPARVGQRVKLDVPGDTHQLNLKDLRKHTTYIFRISASTSIGEGESTEERITVGPQPGSPEAPHQLKFKLKVNGRKLILEWKSGAEGQLPINGYEIQAREAYSCKWTTVRETIGSDTSANFNLNTKLFKPATKYRLRVIAMNGHGVSPPSTQSEVLKTPEKYLQTYIIVSASFQLKALDMHADAGEDAVLFTIRNSSLMYRVIGLAFDYENQRIFYSNIGLRSKQIIAVSFDGTEGSVIFDDETALVQDLAFEKTSGDIYFTISTKSCVARLNVNDAISNMSREPEIIVQLTEKDQPRGIVVDSCFNLIYWTNWSPEHPRIQRSDFDGGEVQDLITENIKYPNSIAIDHISKTLYWTDAGMDTIERCDMDGSNRVVVIELQRAHPFGLSVYGKYIFWTDWQSKKVMRADKYDGNNSAVINHGPSYTLMGIIAVADDSEDCTINKCYGNNHGCQDVCYTDLYGEQSCKCSSGTLNSDQKTCSWEINTENSDPLLGKEMFFECSIIMIYWLWKYRYHRYWRQ